MELRKVESLLHKEDGGLWWRTATSKAVPVSFQLSGHGGLERRLGFAVSLRALTRSVCLADALCPPRPSLAAGRALPALVPISLGAPRPAQPPLE